MCVVWGTQKQKTQAARAISVLADHDEGKRPADSSLNINHILDKEWESKSFTELAKAPPSAFTGLAEWQDSVFKTARIKTIKQIGTWKYCLWAEALVQLSHFENADMSSR